MAHELDSTNGQVSFANSRTDAWHRLGQSVGHAMTAREALDAAHLSGWNVHKMALQIPGRSPGKPESAERHFAISLIVWRSAASQRRGRAVHDDRLRMDQTRS